MASFSSTQMSSTIQDAPRIPARGESTQIRRFDGLNRRTADWDGLRKDTQLWFDDGDCLVHFYAFRVSQRGPSLRVPFKAIEELKCSYLVNECLHLNNKSNSSSAADDNRSDSGYASSFSTVSDDKAEYELYIPTPSNLNRDQAFAYHLNTRNVIAYAIGEPLVGERLSSALTGLWQRLRDWVPTAGLKADFTTYLEDQGYLRFAENVEHSLACMKFAEDARMRELWVDSFSHCVGMHERLDLSPEFAGSSYKTIALITRASLEMDLHIVRVGRAIGCFLEEEMGPVNLGLSGPARDHLDHFRSFLNSHYVDKLGYFPPSAGKSWAKRPWKGMYHDFLRLYDYLVDMESTGDLASSRRMTGGICVEQNVQAYDERHGYTPLPHPLPLLPQLPLLRRQSLSSQKGLLALKLGRTNSMTEVKLTPTQALAVATNSHDSEVASCSLVQGYQRFERQKLEGKLDVAEARKVRWLLVYGVLQMLTSIMKAPKEVRETEDLSYPLCILTTGCPPWDDIEYAAAEEADDVTLPVQQTMLVPDALDDLEGRSARISIHPDCEADNAEDFFAANTISRSESMMSLSATPAPLRITTQLSRSATIRSSVHSGVHALHRSVVGSLNRRGSIRRNSIQSEPKRVQSHCEILVAGYGNGLAGDGFEDNSRPTTAVHESPVQADGSLFDFDFGLASSNDEPTLEHSQVEGRPSGFMFGTEGGLDRSPSDSSSRHLPDSNRSSGYLSGSDSSDTDLSSLDGDEQHDKGGSSAPHAQSRATRNQTLTKPRQLVYRPSQSSFGVRTSCFSVNAGCYTPTGMASPVSGPSPRKAKRHDSIDSDASSVYAADNMQTADIEEEELRGRRRSRALDTLSRFGAVVGG